MLDENELIVREYKLWYPTFYERTVDCVINGYHLLLAILDNGTKLEFCSLDNTLREVTNIYNFESEDAMSDDDYRKAVGDRIKTLLRDRSMKHETLAEMVGVSRQSMSMYINGRTLPNVRIIRRIARALNCDVRDIIDFDYILRN